ncbi:prephenate dehydrogenase/arogenate dehydrogenase family protein [Halobacterium rubrum]|uniref:prephenate dehydrogenase/arogenate dehydrogenase family protein n=1 Tax=Halobacterium TaxID=2239 RepID=UPI001F20ED68|nr:MULTISPECIES: prephenate dehydrogenase/arogenate dehydrogenase family protein [Halobacterium]MDH5019997.1 prephenate dehydrogenase/arogenate dehydrogenase family protein [Halobacterium rubrum]
MEVLVVGAGAVGRWVADTVDAPVAFADVDPQRAEDAAAAAGANARAVALDTDEQFAVVAVAVPLRVAAAAVERHAPKATDAVVDFTGEMAGPLAAMADAAPDAEHASFHPLFAPEHAPGRVAITEQTPGPVTDAVREWFADAGNELVDVGAGEHDDAMATIQGRTHAAVLAFALAADDVPDALATPVYEELAALADRVTGGNPRVYGDIQSAFGGAEEVAAAAQRLADAVDAAGGAADEDVDNGASGDDGAAFAEVYDDAGR